ncbi:hypothetical protein [Brevibacillus fortis]|uniref:hypothetical protein n=1 Tax=Brevibacillus fortis TaxID=2126352 RepID=UPI001FCA1591|nr:hypothetical protein [Brevibacillus fortis]
MVELNFCLKGERGICVQGKEHQLLPGLCSLQFMSEVEARFEYGENEPFHMLGIGIPVSTFHHFMSLLPLMTCATNTKNYRKLHRLSSCLKLGIGVKPFNK